MRILRLGPGPLFVFILFAPVFAQAQTPPAAPRDPQSVLLLQQSLGALTGTATISDVTLSGSANWTAGSDSESGGVSMKATAIGQGRMDLSLSGGDRSETRDISAFPPTGATLEPSGTWQPIAVHNLYSDPSWFFPAFLIRRVLSATNYTISAADAETKNSISVEHLWFSQTNRYIGPFSVLIQPLDRVDIYLNAANLLPVAIDFKTHPENSGAATIAIEVQFANYQSFQGAMVPYHIQKYLQYGLLLDVTVETIQFNSGLSSSEFATQ